MKKLFSLTALVLFLISTSWAEEKISAPVWKAGDKWTFRYDTGGDWTVEIIGEEKGFYVDATTRTKGKMIGKYTRYYEKNSLNCVNVLKDGQESRWERDMLKMYFDFPLYIGKSWSYRYEMLSSSNTMIGLLSEFSAVQYEEIEVPAGKFKTIKVKNRTSVVGTPSSGILHYWWSPEAKAAIKVEYESSNFWANQTYNKFELISFELK